MASSQTINIWFDDFWLPYPELQKDNLHKFVDFVFTASKDLGYNVNVTSDPALCDVLFIGISMYGPQKILQKYPTAIKVLYISENVDIRFPMYNKHQFDFIIGHKPNYHNCKTSSRVPLWFFCYDFLNPNSDIIKQIQNNQIPIENKNKQISMIARSDFFGIRTMLFNIFKHNNIIIDCPGSLLHNTHYDIGPDPIHKHQFLSDYIFNVCPENCLEPGYVTEKPFQAVFAGTIPIYWGSFTDDENNIFNTNRILFFDNTSPDSIFEVSRSVYDLLQNNKSTLNELLQQPCFSTNALHTIDQIKLRFYNIIDTAYKTAVLNQRLQHV